MSKDNLSCEYVRRLFSLDAERGVLIWNIRPVTDFKDGKRFPAAHNAMVWNRQHAGKVAGSLNAFGYRIIGIDKSNYKGHRLIWLYVKGEWPADQLDHIHGVRVGDFLSNLRDASNLENQQNASIRRDNNSGVVGVHWCERDKRWLSRINALGKRIVLGSFTDKGIAIAARKVAETFYGFHPNHGRGGS